MLIHTERELYKKSLKKLSPAEHIFIIELLSISDRFNRCNMIANISQRKTFTAYERIEERLGISVKTSRNIVSKILSKQSSEGFIILTKEKGSFLHVSFDFGSSTESLREAYMAEASYGNTKDDSLNISYVYDKCKELNMNGDCRYEVDHIIPISRKGKHISSNLQILTISEHREKTIKERNGSIIPKLEIEAIKDKEKNNGCYNKL